VIDALDFSSAEENLRHLEFVRKVVRRLLLFLMILIAVSPADTYCNGAEQ
jgi:hypothetical protein